VTYGFEKHMKRLLLVGLLFLSGLCYAQELFVPAKPDHISESDYRQGLLILKNAHQQLVDDNFRITAHDYWNFATAYSTMGQPKELVYDFLFKSKYTGRELFCDVVKRYHQSRKGIDSTRFYKLIGHEYRLLVQDCSDLATKDTFDIDDYIAANKYDSKLVHRLHDLLVSDQQFRKNLRENVADQQIVDHENIREAESIINAYGYPGTSMVGTKFDFVIWIVIQHADLSFQEKYLQTIAETVEKGELNKTPLKMLLDRIYHRKTGKQIFGSQVGVPFADDKIIEDVRLKYRL
jgi:hypothetical protein